MNKKPKLSRSIKCFLIKQKIIDININLFVFEIVIKIPSEYDWFEIEFTLVKFIHFYAVACYGAGWGIGLYKDHITIHAKRVIIGFYWWNKNGLSNVKTDWVMCRMNYKQIMKLQETINELSDNINE